MWDYLFIYLNTFLLYRSHIKTVFHAIIIYFSAFKYLSFINVIVLPLSQTRLFSLKLWKPAQILWKSYKIEYPIKVIVVYQGVNSVKSLGWNRRDVWRNSRWTSLYNRMFIPIILSNHAKSAKLTFNCVYRIHRMLAMKLALARLSITEFEMTLEEMLVCLFRKFRID